MMIKNVGGRVLQRVARRKTDANVLRASRWMGVKHTDHVSFERKWMSTNDTSFSSEQMSEKSTTTTMGTMKEETQEDAANMFHNPAHVVLQNALKHVDTQGWSLEALASGARDAGYPSVAHGMFPRGPIELVDHFMQDSNKAMVQALSEIPNWDSLTLKERLFTAIKIRLSMIEPHLARWPEAMALGALPQNAPTTMKLIASMVDDIWYYSGDQSRDLSWYTKRAIISGVYASTELYMLSDKSPGYAETWRFLDARLDEAVQLEHGPQTVQDIAGMAGIGLGALASGASSLAGPILSQAINATPLKDAMDVAGKISPFPSPLANMNNPGPSTAAHSTTMPAGSTASGTPRGDEGKDEEVYIEFDTVEDSNKAQK